MIPRTIWTTWLSFNKIIPPLIEKYIASQHLPGYEHKIITLDNCFRGSRYVCEALDKAEETKSVVWLVKAADWLRAYHVFQEGGVYLDADFEILPGKNFNDMLNQRMFVVAEPRKTICNGIFGAEKGHPLLEEYFTRINNNYRGDGEMVLRPGVQGFADVIWAAFNQQRHVELGLKAYGPEMFFPFEHETGKMNITPETRAIHHYARSWCEGESNKMQI